MARQTITFVADGSGNTISFFPSPEVSNLIIDNVSLKEVLTPAIASADHVNEFLTGNTDNGREIFFRVDTQQIQLIEKFENFANLLAIMTKLHRGTMVKCFVAIDDEDFYELNGTAKKGVSIIKVHSPNPAKIKSPPIAREVRISWRDSSQQLCRLTQGSIIFLPTEMSLTE